MRETPLHAQHVALGARMAPFGGWHMPIDYGSIVDEHRATRTAAGLFDLSHMGEFHVTGPTALELIEACYAFPGDFPLAGPAARQTLKTAYENAIQFFRSRSPEDLAGPLPPGPVMGGQPISDIVWSMVEHTAHHRGALTVYSRLLGKVPVMPYGG